MEDSKKAPPQSKDSSSPKDKIIELTPELEVISANRGKIIDLTQVLFSPGAPAPKTITASPAPPKPIVARTASPFTAKISRQKGIESDVDAAFDFIQSKAEEIRGPRVEPTPSEEDLRISAPSPIGDWDASLGDESLTMAKAGAAPQEAPTPEPLLDFEEKPMTAAVSEALSVIATEKSSLEGLQADDTLELTDVVHPVDLSPENELPATADEKTQPVQAPPDTVEPLDEEPADLLESAIETDVDEEIIEMTDIVSAEELAAAQAAEEEEIIELTDIVSAEELAAAGFASPARSIPEAVEEEEEEEIIELTDIASAEELAAAGFASPTRRIREAAEEEEEVIELVDRVELPLPEETAAMATELVQNPPESLPEFEPERFHLAGPDEKDTEEMAREVFAAKANKPESDQVIRLDSVLGHARKRQDRISEEITLGIEEELAKEPLSTVEKFPIGIAMEDVKKAFEPANVPGEAEIEAAIEKVIRSKYGQTIEQMIARVVEKVVTREMDNIKRNLMEDQGDSEEI